MHGFLSRCCDNLIDEDLNYQSEQFPGELIDRRIMTSGQGSIVAESMFA